MAGRSKPSFSPLRSSCGWLPSITQTTLPNTFLGESPAHPSEGWPTQHPGTVQNITYHASRPAEGREKEKKWKGNSNAAISKRRKQEAEEKNRKWEHQRKMRNVNNYHLTSDFLVYEGLKLTVYGLCQHSAGLSKEMSKLRLDKISQVERELGPWTCLLISQPVLFPLPVTHESSTKTGEHLEAELDTAKAEGTIPNSQMSIDQWILISGNSSNVHQPMNFDKQMWCIHTTGSYSAIKRNDVLTHATTWMYCEDIMVSKRNQTRKVTYCLIPLILNA